VERTAKKLDLQRNQMKDTEDKDKYKVYGELLNTYGYSLEKDAKELTCTNYYDGSEITIPIPEGCDAREASQKYFEKYNKKKRTKEALTTLLETTKAELDYLLSVKHSLDIAEAEEDVNAIKEELVKSGIIAGKGGKKGEKTSKKSKPRHFVTEDGFDIYVGRNNIQNDYLTFKVANGNDMWFHAKKMPGSHVIVKRKGEEELPDHIYEIAAAAAAFFSSGKENPKVEIDYTERKNLKKPPAANLGYVIYHTNYSMSVVPSISQLTEVNE
jgi:predicted ribosome quality control (RQC) complex YloA/Tae2 family protein